MEARSYGLDQLGTLDIAVGPGSWSVLQVVGAACEDALPPGPLPALYRAKVMHLAVGLYGAASSLLRQISALGNSNTS